MPATQERRDSFTEFFAANENRLRRAFTATFGPDVGRDVCAEALEYGWRHWNRLETMDNPAGYLYRVGLGKGRRKRPSYELSHEPVAVDSPRWFEPGLATALASLSDKQRVVVSLIHGFDWSLSEVAELLGVGKSTVQVHLERGMRRLRRKLGVTE